MNDKYIYIKTCSLAKKHERLIRGKPSSSTV